MRWRAEPKSQREPFWKYGTFVDVRDVAIAVELALTVPLAGHHRALLCAADIAATQPSLDLATQLAPNVPIKDSAPYRANPWRALFDCSTAQATLGWQPRHRQPRLGKRAPCGRTVVPINNQVVPNAYYDA